MRLTLKERIELRHIQDGVEKDVDEANLYRKYSDQKPLCFWCYEADGKKKLAKQIVMIKNIEDNLEETYYTCDEHEDLFEFRDDVKIINLLDISVLDVGK